MGQGEEISGCGKKKSGDDVRFLFITLWTVFFCFAGMIPMGHGADTIVIDADRQYDYALSRFDAGADDEAISEFNRFVFFFPEDKRIPQAYHAIGMAHFRAGRYEAAASVFASQTDHYSALSWQNEAFFMLSRCHFQMGIADQAMLDLRNLMMMNPTPNVLNSVWHEMGWLRISQGRWKDAENLFSRIDPDCQDEFRIPTLASLLAQSDAIPNKSPALAGTLSIIPGGGQLYCGRPQDAVIAFLINAGLIWAACEAFDDDQIALGSVITFVEVGFYAGNIYGAISDAHKFNNDQAAGFRKKLLHYRKSRMSFFPEPGGVSFSVGFDF